MITTRTARLLSMLLFFGCADSENHFFTPPDSTQRAELYSKKGKEYQAQYQGVFRSSYRSIEDIRPRAVTAGIRQITPFLFGPLTYRSLGGVQKGEKIQPLIENAFIQNERVMIPYHYSATWMVQPEALTNSILELPVLFSVPDLQKTDWESCTDRSDAEHRAWSFLWYFWDPTRPGCMHQENKDYQIVQVHLSSETQQTTQSFPEYKKLIRTIDGVPTLSMTFAFGYVEDVENPNPFKDSDYGMREFQKFYHQAKSQLQKIGLTEAPIYQSDITSGSTVIGSVFTGTRNNVALRISILAAAGVDQMDIFSNSFAQKHEGFFSWFGHSRVGSGFDADILKSKLFLSPGKFSISPDYQLVYWAGCNSYSYYTLPFFEMKAALDPQNDPQGTRNLDLISNTLPSLFAFNAANAQIMLQALLQWDKPTSYQNLVNQIEDYASRWGYDVIVNVLGDDDNNSN
ncbi:MAG: hypothetical protein A2622_00390 [Bdellovibrionales bacterium RIFCSPHIGHO2_01_FULL_40_29]|nr:MAG: hypothetical protein A2622_00390 [Bdellovibrionales bacterium RIFCSPHIGHO2_01_FULL_40_29]OFZ32583.1 MAG: hypothetical protein A3D17_04990 [Bdellovibrionales bacterium RIFCSPHIGHO2_02_FULL_40_15]